jgi:hypothetical protein
MPARVVDEHVEPRQALGELLAHRPDIRERGEVRAVERQPVVAGLLADLVEGQLPARLIAAVQQHGRPRAGELDRDALAEPVGRARDQDRLLFDRPHRH